MGVEYTNQDGKGRIDKVLSEAFSDYTRSQLQNWITAGRVTVDGAKVRPALKLKGGEHIVIDPPEPEPLDTIPEDIPIDIVYEDDDVLVVNKPQGMVVHPAPGHRTGTLVNAVLYHSKLGVINDVIRPGIVHRIDKDTSGLLMIAKTQLAQDSLSAQLKAKTNKREYLALVHGNIKENSGTIDAPLGRDHRDRKKFAVIDGGRHAVTHFTVLERFGNYTLIRCKLETGRTHQIRVHMAYIHHPLAGDPVYGPSRTLPGNGQFLHAATLGFKHPRTGEELEFSVPVPPIFQERLDELRRGIDKTRRIK
ncbi:RluA family pseudouridine synthase [Lacticaseibacillus pabuli]|uniref:Pseudouridine synthase n=1 Tax=Lacticaseibacillus pabuli TaxID=3025672 RepID=A0ABY7WNZ7_9LACO|nr:RluA family pseudouridine synthase [Lacticaseibacillus sp. KACC 23028]WDF81529.1 RluA family pseudouridine synthase [Lacticaseibacillus sp. KACC 23028]